MTALTPIVDRPDGFVLPDAQRRVLRWTIYIGYAALVAGVFHGLANALAYAGISILGWFPGLDTYYQGLTAHGVANALIFTFSFSNAFLPLMTARSMARPLHGGLLWTSFALLVTGNVMVVWAIVTGQASVLYTAYAPLQAHWAHYLGLALVVVSTWVALLNMLVVLRGWRKENAASRIPLLAYISLASYLMWFLASLPIAVEFLGFLVPWSAGLVPNTDPLLTRTLFWFTAHAIVYAWLLPAYVSWYALVPRQVGGVLVSDSYTRVVWILFLLLSIPTGFHHQYTDPGISTGMKAAHAVLTFGVFFPSLATAFSVLASLEIGGRRKGGRGLVGWFVKLPWRDPSVSGQILAMLVFVLGGATGLVNASYTMNQVVHNTTWVPGHFHMTVGTAVALTLMAVAYWLIPYLTGRALFSPRLANASNWLYTIGVLIFARGMISGGLDGMPRRTFMAEATYSSPNWELPGMLTAVGGSMMFVAVMLFFVTIGLTLVVGRKGEAPKDIPVSRTLTPPATTGWEPRLDRLGWWVIAAIVLILIAYGPFFLGYEPNFVSPGFRLF